MLRMTMCIVRNTHVLYQRILSSSVNETPHRVYRQDWVSTHSCYWVPLIRSTNASVVSLVRSLSDHQSQSVKNPLCTLLHSWLNQHTCKITPSAQNVFFLGCSRWCWRGAAFDEGKTAKVKHCQSAKLTKTRRWRGAATIRPRLTMQAKLGRVSYFSFIHFI